MVVRVNVERNLDSALALALVSLYVPGILRLTPNAR